MRRVKGQPWCLNCIGAHKSGFISFWIFVRGFLAVFQRILPLSMKYPLLACGDQRHRLVRNGGTCDPSLRHLPVVTLKSKAGTQGRMIRLVSAFPTIDTSGAGRASHTTCHGIYCYLRSTSSNWSRQRRGTCGPLQGRTPHSTFEKPV